MSGLQPKSLQAQAALAHGLEMDVLGERIERLKSRVRLAVIFGGDKSASGSVVYRSHNTRSWKSYEAVARDIAEALQRLGFRHVELLPDDMRLGDRLRQHGIHMAWLNTGGTQGYNPAAHASSMLEMMGVPYIGHDPLAATTLDVKHAFKRAAVSAGIPTSHGSQYFCISFSPAISQGCTKTAIPSDSHAAKNSKNSASPKFF